MNWKNLFNGHKRSLEATAEVVLKQMQLRQPLFMGGSPVYPSASSMTADGYAQNITAYSVIHRMAQKFGHLPRYHYLPKKEGKSGEAVDGSPIAQLLERPCPDMGADSFFEMVALSYLLEGECFIYKNRGGIEKGPVLEMTILPARWVKVLRSPDNFFGVGGYELVLLGATMPLPKEDVIHWKTPNPLWGEDGSHLRGFDPMKPMGKTLQQAKDATDASVAMLQNGGARGVLYQEMLSDLSPEQMSHLKHIIDGKVNQKDVKGAIAVLQGKWGYLGLGATSVDMELAEWDERVVKKLCNAIGLPYELFQSDTTFANKREAWYFFITNTLMPMAASFDAELSRHLIKDFGAKGFIQTDFSELPEMQDMRLRSVEAAAKAWWLTPNEKRRMMMEEPIAQPSMDAVYLPGGHVPIEEARMGEPAEDENLGDY